MSRSTPHPAVPKSIRHKQILDVAEENPNASPETIAAEIPTVTADLVEEVLNEYNSQGNNQPESPPTSELDNSESGNQYPELDDLSETERETLQAIATHPDATQRDLAEILDVSAATISVRVNQIEGFEWEKRQEFAANVLGSNESTAEKTPAHSMSETANISPLLDDLADVVNTLETRKDELAPSNSSTESLDPGLSHKVIHACMNSECITEDEELQIIEDLL